MFDSREVCWRSEPTRLRRHRHLIAHVVRQSTVIQPVRLSNSRPHHACTQSRLRLQSFCTARLLGLQPGSGCFMQPSYVPKIRRLAIQVSVLSVVMVFIMVGNDIDIHSCLMLSVTIAPLIYILKRRTYLRTYIVHVSAQLMRFSRPYHLQSRPSLSRSGSAASGQAAEAGSHQPNKPPPPAPPFLPPLRASVSSHSRKKSLFFISSGLTSLVSN
jgi:hypothetical protein